MNFIVKLLISTIAVIITAYFLDGVIIGNNQFYNSGPPQLNKFPINKNGESVILKKNLSMTSK